MLRSPWVPVAGVVALAVMLVGCGDSDAGSSSAATTAQPTTSAAVTSTPPPTTAPSVTTLVPPGIDIATDAQGIFPDAQGQLLYLLGPVEMTGETIESAQASFQGAWTVAVRFTPEGGDAFDALATQHFGEQLAMLVEGVVMSAPLINATEFESGVVISGDFTQEDATSLADVLSVDGGRLTFRPVLQFAPNEEDGLELLRELAG